VAETETTLWVFHPDPFVERMKWLEELKITLYDPDPKRATAKALEKLKVPFEEAPNAAALAEVKEGFILVGEGVSFKNDAGLGETLARAAARGLPVLCLAPKEGSFALPGAEGSGLPVPDGLELRRAEVITRVDKRLDAKAWPPSGSVVASGLALKTEEGKVVAEAAAGGTGWPWLEAEFGDRGRLAVCGFALIERWDATPAPRYFFAGVLKRLTGSEKEKEKEEAPK
jgi:hypothetical protein